MEKFGTDALKGKTINELRQMYREIRAISLNAGKFDGDASKFDAHVSKLLQFEAGKITRARGFVLAAVSQANLTMSKQVGTTSAVCGQAPLMSWDSAMPVVQKIFKQHGVQVGA